MMQLFFDKQHHAVDERRPMGHPLLHRAFAICCAAPQSPVPVLHEGESFAGFKAIQAAYRPALLSATYLRTSSIAVCAAFNSQTI
jgi:hypothetical protein